MLICTLSAVLRLIAVVLLVVYISQKAEEWLSLRKSLKTLSKFLKFRKIPMKMKQLNSLCLNCEAHLAFINHQPDTGKKMAVIGDY